MLDNSQPNNVKLPMLSNIIINKSSSNSSGGWLMVRRATARALFKLPSIQSQQRCTMRDGKQTARSHLESPHNDGNKVIHWRHPTLQHFRCVGAWTSCSILSRSVSVSNKKLRKPSTATTTTKRVIWTLCRDRPFDANKKNYSEWQQVARTS